MPKKAHARRYARAVFELALENREIERWQADLRNIAILAANADALAVLESPKIKFDVKDGLLKKVLGDISPLAINLLRLLIQKNNVGMIGKITEEFGILVNAERGLQTADVVTAVPMDEAEKKKLAASLGALVGSQIELEEKVDPAILGGVIARVGGKLLDGSTRTRLEALKRQLAG